MKSESMSEADAIRQADRVVTYYAVAQDEQGRLAELLVVRYMHGSRLLRMIQAPTGRTFETPRSASAGVAQRNCNGAGRHPALAGGRVIVLDSASEASRRATARKGWA